MSGLSKIKKEVCVHGYEFDWLSRWTQRDNGFGLQAGSSRVAEGSTKTNLQEDGQLRKESTKLKGKILNGFLDLFPNPDSTVQRVEMIPDMNKKPLLAADREKSIDRNVEHFLNKNNMEVFKECKRIRLDPETTSESHVKRLKTNASDYSGNGTMVVEQGLSQEKVNYFLKRILRCETNKPGARRDQERFSSQIKNLKMRGREDEEFSLRNPWIQRWCKKKSAETHEHGGQEVNTRSTTLEKQFPSIAAMALMGKALSLTPTGKKKTKSLFLWNTQELR